MRVMPRWRRRVAPAVAFACAGGAVLCLVASHAMAADASRPEVKAPTVEVRAPSIVVDVGVDASKMPTSVQTATQKDFERQRAGNLAEFLGSAGQSINVNDFQGNGAQIDINYRGFTASPLLGTPQGLSVYLDGVRINEPFGDVVNWDLIPLSMVSRMDLVAGSNPAFGLNTLGGAIALRTRDGFSDTGTKIESSAGSWGRRTAQLTAGANDGQLGGFFTLHRTEEDGWRTFAPTSFTQAFGRLDLRTDTWEWKASLLWGDTDLTGNGLAPKGMLAQDWKSILTSPDNTRNQLTHGNVTATHWLSDASSLTGLAYRRANDRQTFNGDINDSNSFTQTDFNLGNFNIAGANWLTAAQNDLWGWGVNTCSSSPLTGGPLVCDFNGNGPGSYTDVGYAPIAMIHRSYTNQVAQGLALKYDLAMERHTIAAGATFDRSTMAFRESNQFATIDDQHRVVPINLSALGDIAGNFVQGGERERTINRLDGRTDTWATYVSDTWAPTDRFGLTGALRYNSTHVRSDMRHYDLRFDLNQTPTTNPDLVLSGDDQTFRRLLPSVGFTAAVADGTTLYGSLTRGMRAPSPIELGCAKMTPDYIANATAGMSPSDAATWVRQHEMSCSVQTILTNDPPLKAVNSRALELGIRGTVGRQWNWKVAVFRTDLRDDILFDVDAVSFHTHFFNADKTRRQGAEFAFGGDFGKVRLQGSYGYTSATYQSSFVTGNHSNSSCTGSPSNCSYVVQPGDRMPSVPLHMLKLSVGWDVTSRFTVNVTGIAQSSVFLRGNENNRHAPVTRFGPNGQYVDDGEAPGFAIVHLNMAWKPTKQWTFFAKVNNVFDRRYYTAGQLRLNPFSPDQGGSYIGTNGWNYSDTQWVNVANLAPGAPRALWVGATWAFDAFGSGKSDADR